MNRRIAPLRGAVLALLLACPVLSRAQSPASGAKPVDAAAESRRLQVPRIRSEIAGLLAISSQDVPKGPALAQIAQLRGDLLGLFSADIAAQRAVYQAQPALLDDISSIYADARYASRLPALPWWFQRELALVQVAQAEKKTQREADALRQRERLTAAQRQQLQVLEAREAVLDGLGARIARISSAGDMNSSLSSFFEGASARGSAPVPDGVGGGYGLKPLPEGTAAAPAKAAPVSGAAPPPPAAAAAPNAPSSSFLPSLRVAVDAIQHSFPLPFDPRILAQSASVQALRLQARKAFGSVDGVALACSRNPRPTAYSMEDCSRARDLARRYIRTERALSAAEQSGGRQADYLSRIADLARWKDDAEGFLRDYLEIYQKAHAAQPGALSTWVNGKLAQGDAALGAVPGAQTMVHGALGAMNVVSGAGSSAFYHASGSLSLQMGGYERSAAVVGKEGAALMRSWGFNGAAAWAEGEAASLDDKGAENVAYGTATMIQSKYGLPADWYLKNPQVDGAVLDDLRTFAVAHQYDKWGDALPAAEYFGLADMNPDQARILQETREGAGGLDGYVKGVLDEGGDAFSQGHYLKGAGLWALGMTVKAGDFASQSLAFAGVGEAAAGLARTQAVVNLTGAVGDSALAARASALFEAAGRPGASFVANTGKVIALSPMAVGGVQSGAALFDAWHELPEGPERAHQLAEQSAEFVGAFGTLALGMGAEQPETAPAGEPIQDPEFHQALLSAMGDESPAEPLPALEGAANPAGITSLVRNSRSDYELNGKKVEHVGSGGIKDVVAHPDDPGLVVKIFNPAGDPASGLHAMRFEDQQTELLEQAGAAPPTVSRGAVMSGGDRVGYMVQERVTGSDLATMTPSKYRAVSELFDRLVQKRLSLEGDKDWKAAENIMVGTTESDPVSRAYVVDADGVRQVPAQSLMDRLSGKPDPLRQYYDRLLERFQRELRYPRELPPTPLSAKPAPPPGAIAFPGNPDLAVKTVDARAETPVQGNDALLQRAGVEPPVVEQGEVQGPKGRPVDYEVQELVRGSDLSDMTPYKLEQVQALFDKLIQKRIRLDDPEGSIREGRTPSDPALKVYVTDASTARLEPLTEENRLAGADPLRQYYDGLLAEYAKRLPGVGDLEAGPAAPKPPAAGAQAAPQAFTPSESARAMESSITPERRAAWTAFKQGILGDLAKDGVPPEFAARWLEQTLASPAGAQLVINSRMSPRTAAANLKAAVKVRWARESVQAAYAGTPRAAAVRYWLSQNFKRLYGLNAEQGLALARSDLAGLDALDAKADALAKAKDYDGLLRYVSDAQKTRPQDAPYLVGWKNIALREGYDKATSHWFTDPSLGWEYEAAQTAGRVESFYPTENLEIQSGPSCAIHALYNIVDSHLSQVGGQTPDYAAFEEAVQSHLLPKTGGKRVGWDQGTTQEQISDAAKAMGLKATLVSDPPRDAKAFDDLLRSRQGAAYASIQYREADVVNGEQRGTAHAVFIGERWTDSKGRSWYSVADSNTGPGQLSFYTWDQLRARLNFVVLLAPEDPATFQASVARFVSSERGPPGKSAPGDWARVLRDPDYAREQMRQFPGVFTSRENLLDYARSQVRRRAGSGDYGEAAEYEGASAAGVPAARAKLNGFLRSTPGLLPISAEDIEAASAKKNWSWTSWNGAEHFKKHGAEFTARLGREPTRTEYETMAKDLLTRALADAAREGADKTTGTLLLKRKAANTWVAIDLVNRDVVMANPDGTMISFYHIYPGKTIEQTVQQVLSYARASP